MANNGDSQSTPNVRSQLRPSRIVAWVLLGGLLLGVLSVVLLVVFARDWRPRLTAAELDAAADRWRRHGPASYTLDLQTSGRQQDRIHVEVHSGEVTDCTVNGRRPDQRRVWSSWIVPQQFNYIRQDLANDAAAQSAGSIQRAEFDSRSGLPWYYHHISAGNRVENGWQITRIESLDK